MCPETVLRGLYIKVTATSGRAGGAQKKRAFRPAGSHHKFTRYFFFGQLLQ
jgi:hypothetical protein